MFVFLLWCLLFILCWPLALFALVLYPIVWLLVALSLGRDRGSRRTCPCVGRCDAPRPIARRSVPPSPHLSKLRRRSSCAIATSLKEPVFYLGARQRPSLRGLSGVAS